MVQRFSTEKILALRDKLDSEPSRENCFILLDAIGAAMMLDRLADFERRYLLDIARKALDRVHPLVA